MACVKLYLKGLSEVIVICKKYFWFSYILICRPKRTLYSKKDGVDLIRYTHAANTVVYSSNKIDGTYSSLLATVVIAFAFAWRFKCRNVTVWPQMNDVKTIDFDQFWRTYCSLWSEVVVCTVWGSMILPHTGANCTSDCLAQGCACPSQLSINACLSTPGYEWRYEWSFVIWSTTFVYIKVVILIKYIWLCLYKTNSLLVILQTWNI